MFSSNPVWKMAAERKDPVQLAAAVYSDLKRHLYSGTYIYPVGISNLISTISFSLYTEFDWGDAIIDQFRSKFEELNKYYPAPQDVNMPEIPQVFTDILQKLKESNQEGILSISSLKNENKALSNISSIPITQENIPQQNTSKEKDLLKEIEKYRSVIIEFIRTVGSIFVWILALIGLLTILGVI